jgi:FlaA1/EpsC-like NDP-sugar epimerase
MTIPEACQLVLEAGAIKGGEIYILIWVNQWRL